MANETAVILMRHVYGVVQQCINPTGLTVGRAAKVHAFASDLSRRLRDVKISLTTIDTLIGDSVYAVGNQNAEFQDMYYSVRYWMALLTNGNTDDEHLSKLRDMLTTAFR